MESSSSNEGSPNNVYLRMNSEVIEKPSHFEYYSDESSSANDSDSLDILALLTDSSSPSEQEVVVLESGCLSPYSSHCSSKGDHDGSNGSDLEGDLDEGFDEEFEFYENDEVKDNTNIAPSFDELHDLDLTDKQLQHILLDQSAMTLPNAALLDDFDLGVDVFESEQQVLQSSDNLVKPPSPYQLTSISSPVSVVSNDMPQQEIAYTGPSSFYPPSTSLADFDTINSYSNSNMTFTTSTQSVYNPTLSSVNVLMDVMDLNEASRLMTNNFNEDFVSTTSVLGTTPHSAMSTVSSPGPSNHGSSRRSLSPAPSSHYHHPQTSGACFLPSPYSPAESAISPDSTYSAVSFTAADKDDVVDVNEQVVVDMPFHKFKKVLDDSMVAEDKKEELKGIRRRGKNKVAAKTCRQKKITLINGLQHEIDQMKLAKTRLSLKTRSLEQEIACLKQQCAVRYNCMKSSR